MLSKFWHGGQRFQNLFAAKVKAMRMVQVRKSTLLPPTQYDTPWPKRLTSAVLVTNWEVIPLFAVTGFAMLILFFSIGWAIKNKVDVVYTTHNRECISRTMDLRNPSCHKLLTINQKYEPWNDMQDALDAVVVAEKRHRVRMELAKKCYPQP